MDDKLINEIVCKVKSEGLFDQFRRECLADVDTKPAYQNLQSRVESSVYSFLKEQEWNSQLNKNQIRERLRKMVLEKKFFEAGIERIIDQVVNPKLNANFVPKIEDIAYKILGIHRPSMNEKGQLEIDTAILPVYDLEQVSPDSEKSQLNYHIFESVEKNDDLESPAFEPIESRSYIDMDISDEDNQIKMKSNVSSISGLTSNESNESGRSLKLDDCLYGINEETQMQQFNGSSSSNEKEVADFRFHDELKKDGDQHRSGIKDDHFTHKVTSRQRSNSKDSNDGFTYHPNKLNSSGSIQQSIENQSKSSDNRKSYGGNANTDSLNLEATHFTEAKLLERTELEFICDDSFCGFDKNEKDIASMRLMSYLRNGSVRKRRKCFSIYAKRAINVL